MTTGFLALVASTPLLGATSVGAALEVWDFSAGDQGLVSEGDTLQWRWEATPDAGPGGPSWGTNPDGQYLQDTDDALRLVLPSLAAAKTPTLVVHHAYDVVPGDRAVVEVDDGSGWGLLTPDGGLPDPVDGFVGSSGGWVTSRFDLTGLGPELSVRFRLVADASQADEGWYLQRLELFDGDVTPPRITEISVPQDNQGVEEGQAVTVRVDDDVAVDEVTLVYQLDGDGVDHLVTMGRLTPGEGSGLFEGQIPGQPADTMVSWFVTASDGSQSTRFPAATDASFRVFLAAPSQVEVTEPLDRVASEVELAWAAPESPHGVDHYQVLQGGVAVAMFEGEGGVVPLTPGTDARITVHADYGPLGVGDPSEALTLGLEVPELVALRPAESFAGTSRWVEVEVAGLYLLEGATEVSLGEGVSVDAVEVRDVEHAQLLVTPSSDAVGLHDLHIHGPHGSARFPGAFEVVDQAEAPRILSVSPPTLLQGAEDVFTVVASEGFGSELIAVVGDEDLVLTRGPTTPGAADALEVGVAAKRSAAVGDHVVLIDDGVRLWEVPIEVTEQRVAPARSCAHVSPWPVGGWFLVGLSWVVRRRRRTT